MDSYFTVSGEFLYLRIKAVPGALKSAMGEVSNGRLRIRIAAAPEGGKANEELRSFLAKNFGLAKKDVILESGEKSRLKTLRLPAVVQNTICRTVYTRSICGKRQP